MAEIDVQRRKKRIWPWLVGILLLGLIFWGLAAWLDDEPEVAAVSTGEESFPEPAAPVATAPGGAAMIPVAVIVTQPAQYAGQTVSGEARVAEAISDRGFWIEQEGQRIFAVIDEPVPETKDVNAGQTVRLTATVYTPETMDQMPGVLEADARQAIQNEPAYLYVRAQDIQITDRPQNQ